MKTRGYWTEIVLGVIALALALAAIAAGMAWVEQYRRFTIEDILVDQRRILQLTLQHLSNTRRQVEFALNAVDQIISTTPQTDPRHNAALKELARLFKISSDDLLALALIDNSGHETNLGDPSWPAHDLNNDFFRTALHASAGAYTLGTPMSDPASHRVSVPIALTLRQPHHGISIVYADIRLHALNKALGSANPRPRMTIQLAHTPTGEVFANWPSQPASSPDQAIRQQLLRQARTGQIQWMIAQNSQQNPYTGTLISYTRHANLALIVNVNTPMGDLLQPVELEKQAVTGVAILFIVFEVAAFVAVILLLRRIRHEQQQLAQDLEQETAHASALHQRALQLESAHSALEQLSRTDPLTALYNRRHFIESLGLALNPRQISRQGFCLVYLDIDHFKNCNDTYGHQVGDEILQTLAQHLKTLLRPGDIIARLGGEEFGILLPKISEDQAILVLERIRHATKRKRYRTSAGVLDVTFSAGITAARADDSAQTIMHRADQGLYQAKRQGRDRVIII